MRYLFSLAIVCLMLAGAAFAQEHPNVAKGLSGGGGFGTADVDTVNPFNGNLAIRLPIGQRYPVNAGLSYQLQLVYNSQVWEHEIYDDATRAIPARGANAGLGWSLHLGRLNPPQIDQSSFPSPDYNRNTYMAGDGSLHTFYPTLHEGEATDPGFAYTRDGSYLRLNTNNRTIEFPDGSIHTFSSVNNGYLSRIQDRFGNFVQVDYFDCNPSCVPVSPPAAHRWRITDTQGRTHWIHLRDTGQPYQPLAVFLIDLQSFQGLRAQYKLFYNDSADENTPGASVALTGCGGSTGSGSNHLVWFLTRLQLPEGPKYELPQADYFAFDAPAASGAPCRTGLLQRLTLPTRGKVGWEYMTYKFPNTSTSRPIWHRSTGVGTRLLLTAASTEAGRWTYSTALSGGNVGDEKQLLNTVTDPLGNQTRLYFSVCSSGCTSTTDGPYEYGLPISRDAGSDGAGRFLSSEVLNAGGAVRRQIYLAFEHDVPLPSTYVQDRSRLNQRVTSQRTQFNDDPLGTYADEVAWEFDGYGHFRYRQTSASSNFPGSNIRTSFSQFNPQVGIYGQPGYSRWPSGSPWVLYVSGFQWEAEGSKCAARSMAVDPATGWINRTRIHRLDNCGESNQDILVETSHDGAGNLLSERYYGGDTQWVPTGNIHAITLPQPPQYRIDHATQNLNPHDILKTSTYINAAGGALPFKSLDLTIDSSTGLTRVSRDVAGKSTSFSYDLLGRLTMVDPADDLLTTYTYCTACASGDRARVTMARKATVTGAEVTASRRIYDDWGRLIGEEERMPPAGAWSSRWTSYNALGWTTYVSEKGSSFGTSFSGFDPFGRPTLITPADGGNHRVTVSYQGIREVARTAKVATSTTGEASATTTEVYDRHGRLYEVTEPNGVKTRYEYDAGNRLSKVCQGATGSGTATCGQQRVFTYDNRGFLLSEQHPEKGLNGNGTVSYLSYDARGHAQRRIDGPNDLTFSYDRAERLLQVRETGGSQRLLKVFTYAPANGTDSFGLTDWKLGKVVQADRYNYPPISNPPPTALVQDTFQYAGTEGRISQTSRQLILNGVAEEKFTTRYGYDGLGLVASISYPDCVFGDCVADSMRSVSFTRSYGRLVGVPGFTGNANGVTQISYHSNGLIHQVPHANGVLFTQQNDPFGMLRPADMTAVRGTTTLWTAGTHSYDGTGNLKANGGQTFVYDSLSRITQGNLPGSSQTYTYDNFGNIQSITTGGVLVNTPTSASTNRLTSGSYDTAGNLTSWSGSSYTYDAFNLLSHYVSGTEDWFHIYGADDERFWAYRPADNGFWTLRGLNGQVLRRYSNNWSTIEDYIYRDGVLLAAALPGETRHFDADHLGTPRLITNQAGTQLGVHRYYPFGKEQTALQEGEALKFTGHERDLGNVAGDGDDLDYMHARYYSPLTGRFLSMDRMGGYPSAPQSWNRYSYVHGRPLSFVDPDGYAPIPPELLRFYNAHFGADFSNVSLHVSEAVARTGNLGVTFGNHVFLSPKTMREVQAFDRHGIGVLGHELVHVLQYRSLGIPRFLEFYAFDIHAQRHQLIFGVTRHHDALLLEQVANSAERRMLYTEETVTSCGWVDGASVNCSTTVTQRENPLPTPPLAQMTLPASMLFSGLGLSSQGFPYSLVGSPYDFFFSGAVCIEKICL